MFWPASPVTGHGVGDLLGLRGRGLAAAEDLLVLLLRLEECVLELAGVCMLSVHATFARGSL